MVLDDNIYAINWFLIIGLLILVCLKEIKIHDIGIYLNLFYILF